MGLDVEATEGEGVVGFVVVLAAGGASAKVEAEAVVVEETDVAAETAEGTLPFAPSSATKPCEDDPFEPCEEEARARVGRGGTFGRTAGICGGVFFVGWA